MIRLLDLLKEAILVDSIPTIPVLQESLAAMEAIQEKTLLTRRSRGIKSGAAKISADPPKKFSIDPTITDVYTQVMELYGLSHLIYCSHGKATFHLGGDQYYMIPKGDYKVIWSPEVPDLLVTAKYYYDSGMIDEFPYNSYKQTWPVGDVSEVLVDCNEYYLITTRIPIIMDWMKKNGVGSPTTYKDLHTIVEGTLKRYV